MPGLTAYTTMPAVETSHACGPPCCMWHPFPEAICLGSLHASPTGQSRLLSEPKVCSLGQVGVTLRAAPEETLYQAKLLIILFTKV